MSPTTSHRLPPPPASHPPQRYVFTTGAYYFGPWSDNKMHGDGGCFVDAKGRKCGPPTLALRCTTVINLSIASAFECSYFSPPPLPNCSWTGVFHNGSGPGLTTL